jgi:hypothetical protein
MSQTQVERLFIADQTSLMADEWRLNSGITTSGGGSVHISANWERNDTAGFGLLGTGMTESSGTFSFPTTGIYEVQANLYANAPSGGATSYIGVQIKGTQNNSDYTDKADGYGSANANGYTSVTVHTQFDVTNTTNDKIRIHYNVADASTGIGGTSTRSVTYVRFKKLGDT